MPSGSPLSFELVIIKGPGEGARYAFTQSETSIGRADDNDVVVRIAGVSRRHARIVEQAGRFFLEDLGSSNGTLVNGELISAARELSDGDQLELGPVTFAVALAGDAAGATKGGRAPSRSSEELVSLSASGWELEAGGLEHTRELTKIKGPTLTPTDSDGTPAAPTPQLETRLIDVEKVAPASAAASATRIVERDEALAPPARRSQETRLVDTTAAKGRPIRARSQMPPEQEVSAAERYRQRRHGQNSAGAQLSLWWSELSSSGKRAVVGIVAALALVAVAMTYYLSGAAARGPTLPEPDHLSIEPIAHSFGLGAGVNFVRPDMKVFYFEFTAPTQAVAVLRFQAGQISPEEVSISLNGLDQGYVAPDTTVPDRELEVVFPPTSLKKNETNTLIFDSTYNPPGEDPWQVSNLRLEIIPVPELPKDDLVSRAREFALKGREYLEQQEVGPDNLFKAWKSYRQAWLTLMALPESDRSDLFRVSKDQMESVSRELDHKCRTLMLDAIRAMQLNSPDLAKQTLEEVPRYFPTTEHRCHNLALQKLFEYGL